MTIMRDLPFGSVSIFQMERKVCVDDFTHPFLDLADRLLVYVFTVVNNAIIAFRDGMLQVQSR